MKMEFLYSITEIQIRIYKIKKSLHILEGIDFHNNNISTNKKLTAHSNIKYNFKSGIMLCIINEFVSSDISLV